MFSSVGLSGITAAAQALDLAGHNISNASTTGYKQHSLHFTDMVIVGGRGGLSVGSGVQVAGGTQNFSQGSINTSSNGLDCAITGPGFFRMNDPENSTISYSRNGSFRLDADNNLVNASGQHLTGLNAIDGVLIGGSPQPLKITATSTLATVTSKVAANINIDSGSTVLTNSTFDPEASDSYNYSTGFTSYDGQGTEHVTTLYFKKTGDNAWNVFSTTALASSTEIPTNFSSHGGITFKDDGSINGSSTLSRVTINTSGDVADVDISAMTQTASGNYQISIAQDGKGAGILTGFNIGKDGKLYGSYTNGESNIVLGQISLANFSDPTGLKEIGNSSWIETAASGTPSIGTPGVGTLGSIQSFALEQSNVDMTAELIGLMAAQRLYQANAQTIKAQDQVAQTTVNMS
jgi:flagellar hook protein FlgE